MKIRIKFTKTGALKYIGHLDVMRFFQKLNRRADIPVAYSEGFSPHQILSFSPPLSLGAESIGEYADLEITEAISSKDAIERLNNHTVDGIRILSFKELPQGCENAMASVKAAKYKCILKPEIAVDFPFRESFLRMMSEDVIIVTKKTKKNESEVDIKPLIYSYKFTDEKNGLELLLSAGSVNNLKPELVFCALFEKNGQELPENSIAITRLDLFTETNNGLISLDDIGNEIY